MIDHALALIIQTLNERCLNTLLVLDENTDISLLAAITKPATITVITQRFDQHQQLQNLGFNALLNDYSFDDLDHTHYDIIAMRIGKQKAISHRIVNQAPLILGNKGQLILAGTKQEGLQSIVKKLKTLAPLLAKQRSKAQNEMYTFGSYDSGDIFDDHDYPSLRPSATLDDINFISKPGIYGWQKIDLGSRLLINSIDQDAIKPGCTALDLGCGYGFLSVIAAKRFGATITATDNNIAAVNACNANLKNHNCKGEAIISDCANSIKGKFDLVLCNPPFHRGFNIKNTLTEKFLKSAKMHLKPNGAAYFVVNEFIPLEQTARPIFNTITLLNKSDGFKVFRLQNA